MKCLLSDPLLHFIALGAVLFSTWHFLNPDRPDNNPHTIKVDQAALLEFMQLRMRAFNEADAQARLASFSDEALTDVVNAFVREEALHRSALAMGLGIDDYVIKQRLVQKMEYLAEGVAAELPTPTDAQLDEFYKRHQAQYTAPAHVSFTHVFFSASRHGEEQAAAVAQDTLIDLNRRQVPFTGATGFGERFPYQVNYVERTREDVVSHFGAQMADDLFALSSDTARWRGVYTSSFGKHLVLLTRNAPARVLDFTEVRSRVLQDFMAEQLQKRKAGFVSRVVGAYTVDVAADLQRGAMP